TLLQKPNLLLLDEPTNHLDAESVAWLERHLQEYPGTVVSVTHDRYFLDNVAQWILELDRGRGIPWKGNYSSWLEQKQQRGEEGGAGAARAAAPGAGGGALAPGGGGAKKKSPPQPVREAGRPGIRRARRRAGPANPAGAAPRRPGRAGGARPQGLRRQPPDG